MSVPGWDGVEESLRVQILPTVFLSTIEPNAMNETRLEGRGILVVSKDGNLLWIDKKKGPKIVSLTAKKRVKP